MTYLVTLCANEGLGGFGQAEVAEPSKHRNVFQAATQCAGALAGKAPLAADLASRACASESSKEAGRVTHARGDCQDPGATADEPHRATPESLLVNLLSPLRDGPCLQQHGGETVSFGAGRREGTRRAEVVAQDAMTVTAFASLSGVGPVGSLHQTPTHDCVACSARASQVRFKGFPVEKLAFTAGGHQLVRGVKPALHLRVIGFKGHVAAGPDEAEVEARARSKVRA